MEAFLEAGIAFIGAEAADDSLGRFMVREDVVITGACFEAFAALAGDEDVSFQPQGRLANFIGDLAPSTRGPGWSIWLPAAQSPMSVCVRLSLWPSIPRSECCPSRSPKSTTARPLSSYPFRIG